MYLSHIHLLSAFDDFKSSDIIVSSERFFVNYFFATCKKILILNRPHAIFILKGVVSMAEIGIRIKRRREERGNPAGDGAAELRIHQGSDGA